MSETNPSDADGTTPYVESINGRVNFATPTSGGLADVGVTPPPEAPRTQWTSADSTTSSTATSNGSGSVPSSAQALASGLAPASSTVKSNPPTVSGAALELDAADSDVPLTTDRLISDRKAPKRSTPPSPIDTIVELKDLSIGYARQETIGPLKRLARWAGYGVGGAVLMGLGGFLLALALLRGLQHVSALDGGWSWVPYLAVAVVLAIAIALTARAMTARALPRETTSD